MIIGVSGAGGHLGGSILAQLRSRGAGNRLIGISRSPDSLPAGIESRAGDYNQPHSLAAAYAGLDKLVIIPSPDMTPGARARQHVAAVEAAVAAGVKHIVFVSAAGTRQVAEPGVWASYYPAEQRLMQSAPRWTILRMNYYSDTFVEEAHMGLGVGVMAGLAENRAAFVARDDVAGAAAGILSEDDHAGAIYNATGPKTYSGAERCAAVSAAAGKPLQFITLPEDGLRGALTQAGLPAELCEMIINLQKALAMGGFDIVTRDVERLSGRRPQTLEDSLKRGFA